MTMVNDHFLRWGSGKESACNVGDRVFFFFFKFYFIFKLYITVLDLPNIKMNPPQVTGFLIAGLGRSSGEGNDNPLQYTCLGNLMDRGAW